MKRVISLLLICLILCGCSSGAEKPGVYFVYPKKDYLSTVPENTVSREHRDVTQQDLSYLVKLYLLGPQDEDLEAVYPPGVRLESLQLSGSTLTINLSRLGNQLTDIAFTLAGACLAQTCFSLCEANFVVISSGDRQITLKRDTLVFQDSSATLETTASKSD